MKAHLRAAGKPARDFFDTIDANGDGLISEKELLRGIESLGLKLDATEASRLLRLADADGSGALDAREFAKRFAADAESVGGAGRQERHDAAVVAQAAQSRGYTRPEELFSKFASFQDAMSRREFDKLCAALDVNPEAAGRLWRLLDPRASSATDARAFVTCLAPVWPRARGSGGAAGYAAGADAATQRAAATGGDAHDAAAFLRETARDRRLTLHELFDLCDRDQDGFVSADDLFVLAASRPRRAPGRAMSRAIASSAIASSTLSPDDFSALLEPRGAQYVDVDTLLELMAAQAPHGRAGGEIAGMALLQEHFSKLDRQRRVAPSAQSFKVGSSSSAGGARPAAVPASREPLRCVHTYLLLESLMCAHVSLLESLLCAHVLCTSILAVFINIIYCHIIAVCRVIIGV